MTTTTIPQGWNAERHAEMMERVAKWDAGESVWALEMGGLGPGYEQAIQMLAIECIRDALAKPLPEKPKEWEWIDPAVKRTNHVGYSGAQVGAAQWLAYRLCVEGWASLSARAKAKGDDDRSILVSTHWPRTEVSNA